MAQIHHSTAAVLLIIILCLSFLLSISTAQPFNATTDESTLLSIKSFITSDPNNIITTNWSQGTSFCTWTGVTCSPRHQRVTSLDLFNFELAGTVSPQIGNLSFLTFLDISNNSFTGVIPDTIGSLFRLRELRMNANQISGNVPPSLGLLGSLEVLDLSDNNLRGNVPWEIFNITGLQVIMIQRNQELSGELPPEICPRQPSSLQQLSLSGNRIIGEIPRHLSNCEGLRILSLSFNNLTGNLTPDIGRLSQLQILSLTGNQLTGPIPPSIGNLSNLGTLALSRNNFEGMIPAEFGGLSNLTFLSLGENRLNGELPPSLFNLTRLQTLSLTVNGLSGTLPPSIDTMLPNLQVLFLGMNTFSGEIPATISNLSQLTTFDITNNSFTGLVPRNLGNLRQLQVLRLGLNGFTNNLSIPEQDFLTPLTNCENLTYLHFASNPITGVLPASIGNLSVSLQYFIAGYCRLSGTIPSGIGRLNGLYWLHIGNNSLTGEIPTTLGGLTNLQRITLSVNNLQGSLPDSICGLENLYYAGFSYNMLSGQLPRCLGNLSSLQRLFLHNNLFNSIIPSNLWYNARIQVLSLSRNHFYGSLPSEISNLNSVDTIDLSDNLLSGNIPATIGELQSLTALDMHNNRFNGSIPSALADVNSLQILDLSHNNLSGSIPMSFENLPNLNSFDVSFNELSGEIPDGGHFQNFTPEVFMGNRDLCGPSRLGVKACKISTPNSTRNNHRRLHRLLTYILPIVASVILAAAFILFFVKHHARKTASSSETDLALGITHDRISYYEILRATSKLDPGNLIGKGSIGSVYKGTFSDEMVFAVKVFNLEVQAAFKSFDTECQIMRSLRHRNLVKIITSCSNPEFKALVMEYMPNGNLDKWLYAPDCGLSIDLRMKIMIDVGSAMEYLHHGYSPAIAHCDLKPSNILIDGDMVARVGDFGIAKLLMEDNRMQQTKTLGTIGYMAPEYGSSGLVSTMGDIYSYGILLMETFTGKRPTDELFLGELSMRKWISESYPKTITQIVDDNLLNQEGFTQANIEECLKSIMGLAIQCTEDSPEERPNMKDVLASLKKIYVKLQ